MFCPGCGTPLVPPVIEQAALPADAALGLTAGKATLILLAFFGAEICIAILCTIVLLVLRSDHGIRQGAHFSELIRSILPPVMLVSTVHHAISATSARSC